MWSFTDDTNFLPHIFEWLTVVYASYMDLKKKNKKIPAWL